MAELTEKLAVAVAGTLREHHRAIEGGAGEPRSLHIEIDLRRDGGIRETTFWIEHALTPNQAIGLGGSRARHP